MYYHVRLDKTFHNGCTDMDSRIEWDFRSLGKALAMIGLEFDRSHGPPPTAPTFSP